MILPVVVSQSVNSTLFRVRLFSSPRITLRALPCSCEKVTSSMLKVPAVIEMRVSESEMTEAEAEGKVISDRVKVPEVALVTRFPEVTSTVMSVRVTGVAVSAIVKP